MKGASVKMSDELRRIDCDDGDVVSRCVSNIGSIVRRALDSEDDAVMLSVAQRLSEAATRLIAECRVEASAVYIARERDAA